MKRVRFAYPGTRPPGGGYSFTYGGELVTGSSRSEMATKVRDLLLRKGASDIPADPFVLVMEQMCENGSVPSDFCIGDIPHKTFSINLETVKANTKGICSSGSLVTTADNIMARASVCTVCSSHVKSGFCSTCTGVLAWFYGIIGARRPKVPCDKSLGICTSCMSMAAAVISFDDVNPGVNRPDACWKKKE